MADAAVRRTVEKLVGPRVTACMGTQQPLQLANLQQYIDTLPHGVTQRQWNSSGPRTLDLEVLKDVVLFKAELVRLGLCLGHIGDQRTPAQLLVRLDEC